MDAIERLQSYIQDEIGFEEREIDEVKERFAIDPLYAFEHGGEQMVKATVKLKIYRKIERTIRLTQTEAAPLKEIETWLISLRQDMIDELIGRPYYHHSTLEVTNVMDEWRHQAEAHLVNPHGGKITNLIDYVQKLQAEM